MTLSPRIVLIDNDPEGRAALTNCLRQDFPGADLLLFKRCVDALGPALEPAVSLIITNGQIAETDGIAFVKKLRTEKPDLPVIMSAVRPELKLQAMSAGVTRFLNASDFTELRQVARHYLTPAPSKAAE